VVVTPAWAAEGPFTASQQPVSDESQIDWYQVGATTLDVAMLRPLGVLSTVAGFVFFLASAPFVAPSERLETTWDIFVFGSYDYTFVRPVGEL
jgi:hypothetical protein